LPLYAGALPAGGAGRGPYLSAGRTFEPDPRSR